MNEEAIFHLARSKPPGERSAFLAQACADDAPLRRRVEALLHADDNPGGFMASPPAGASKTPGGEPLPGGGPVAEPVPEGPGTNIGPYRLLEQIGEGGMGVVFLAEQSRPVRRQVAVKVIKAGMDTRQVVARFEAERQALAMMDHPNIAKVLDAGATDTGRPYFVMDLVKGVPITRYCDEHRLTVRQRLELFVPVCRGVQHAHTKGIIHRDLKPSNVLIAPYDGAPVPRVIDFGVAKATAEPLTEKTMFTGFGAMVGTPEYMSPEQAELNQVDVDTRSDVYSLGVLLYELLTGTTPLDRGRFERAALLEVLRVVREQDPPPPSTRLSTSNRLPDVAASRGVDPRRLHGLVRGELDWIVMKALEKDRSRRYETANGLARDVERYLRAEPVHACPPSSAYRLRKFARRHAGPVLAGALLALALVGGVVATGWQAVRANRSAAQADRDRALAVRERNEKQAALAAEHAALAAERAAREQAMDTFRSLTDDAVAWQLARAPTGGSEQILLYRIVEHYEQFASLVGDTPEARFSRAQGSLRLGFLRARLREHDEARAAYERAVGLFRQLAEEYPAVPDYPRYLALSETALGNVLRDAGKSAEAAAADRRAAAVPQPTDSAGPGVASRGPPDYRRYLVADHDSMRRLLLLSNRPLEAEAEQRRGLVLREQLAAEFPGATNNLIELGRDYNVLAALLWERGEAAEALGWYERGIQTLTPLVARDPRGLAARIYLDNVLRYRAMTLAALDRHADAVPDWDRAIELADGPRRVELEFYRALCLARADPTRAIAAAHALIARDPDDLEGILRYVHILIDAGDRDAVKALCERAVGRGDKMKCIDLPGRRSYLLARLCLVWPDAFDDWAAATRFADHALQSQPRCAYYLHTLGMAHYRAGRPDEAVRRLEESTRAEPWAGAPLNSLALAMAHHRLGHADESRRWLGKATRSAEADRSHPWEPTRMGMHIHDWLVWPRLRREAESLVPAEPH